MPQLIGVPKETAAGEKRVATVPEAVEKLIKLGFTVAVESGAGDAARSATMPTAPRAPIIADDAAKLWAAPTSSSRCAPDRRTKSACCARAAHWSASSGRRRTRSCCSRWPPRKVTVLAMDSVPRISRAQKWTRCRSMANVAGYRAVIEAAHDFGRFFTGQITAAGKVPPAKVFVDRRRRRRAWRRSAPRRDWAPSCAPTTPAPRSPIRSGRWAPSSSRSITTKKARGGGGYAKVMSEGFQKAQRDMFAKQAKEVDIIITTALIPGKPAPKLITAEMVQVDEAGQRDRRHGRRAGRQLRADRAGQGRGQARRDHHRLHRSAEPPGDAVHRRCTRPTCSASPRNCARPRTASSTSIWTTRPSAA